MHKRNIREGEKVQYPQRVPRSKAAGGGKGGEEVFAKAGKKVIFKRPLKEQDPYKHHRLDDGGKNKPIKVQ